MISEVDKIRMDVWTNAWCSTARASNNDRKEVCNSYAAECLKQFDKEFYYVLRDARENKPELLNE